MKGDTDHDESRRQTWVSTSAGSHLLHRRSRDTTPELQLRREVHRLGLRFRVHKRVTPRCTPDFVLPRWQLAVFVDGCFWHGCPQHGMKRFKGPNAQLWREKFEANLERDRRNNASLAEAGWRVVRVWECDVHSDATGAARLVRDRAYEDTADRTSSNGSVAASSPFPSRDDR
ncbi:very short patch repair endonuclease [Frankia sp. Cj3]|uniref:very short patch repair endonuclease n=1 Tax=Frankia sp. Cj3 TaxID=2880976 RepID=UPI001EF6A9C9|nr:very short patch repair endonuclease [Frankia sp. Cj3]